MFTLVCQRRLSIIFAVTIAAAIALIAVNQAHAAFNVSDPIPGMIRLVAIDTDPSGNTAASVVDVDPTHTANVGGTFDVDVVVDEIDPAQGLLGWDMDFHYNPAILRVVGFRSDLLLHAAGSPIPIEFPDTLPDSDGDFFSGALDFNLNAKESGEGVLTRYTLECVNAGTSALFVDYTLASGPDPNIYYDADPGFDVDAQPIPILDNLPATATCTPPAVGGAVSLAVGGSSGDSVSPVWYIAPCLALTAAAAAFVARRRLTRRRID